MKFCEKGRISVYSAYDTVSNIMSVSVIDTGRGIQADEKKKLFHLFGKLESTAEVNAEGSGMGLLICKRLVNANKGEIEIHSDGKDMGCTVRFTMQMMIPSEDEIEDVKHRGD